MAPAMAGCAESLEARSSASAAGSCEVEDGVVPGAGRVEGPLVRGSMGRRAERRDMLRMEEGKVALKTAFLACVSSFR